MRFLAILLLLTSCSSEWHLQRACKKSPDICQEQTVRIDTFVVRDTFTYTDTFVTKAIDTITIDTGSVQVRIIRDHDIIRTIIKQKPDTAYITIEKKLPPQVIFKEHWFKWWYLLIIFAIFVIIIKLKWRKLQKRSWWAFVNWTSPLWTWRTQLRITRLKSIMPCSKLCIVQLNWINSMRKSSLSTDQSTST